MGATEAIRAGFRMIWIGLDALIHRKRVSVDMELE